MARIGIVYVNDQPQLSMGIGYISAMLKKYGHEVKLWDTYYITNDEVINEILNSNIDILMIGVTSLNYERGLKISKIIKEKKQNITTLFGGWHSVIDSEGMIRESSIDLVCIGEGEYAALNVANDFDKTKLKNVSKILNIWSKKNGKIIRNPPRKLASLDNLPIIDRDIFAKNNLLNRGKFFFLTARGCPYNCSYCCNKKMVGLYSKIGSPYVRFRSIEKCMEELKMIKERYNPPELFFTDEMFLISSERVKEFCKAYKENKIGIPFGFMARVERVTDEIIGVLKSAGCVRIHFGVESGSEELRRKYLNRYMTNEQIINAFDICRKHGIKTASYNMIGLPFETAQTIKETFEINRRCKPDELQVTILYPFPNTEIREIYEKNNLLDMSKISTKCNSGYYNQYITKNPNLSYSYIKHQQIFIMLYLSYSKILAYFSKFVPHAFLDKYYRYISFIVRKIK